MRYLTLIGNTHLTCIYAVIALFAVLTSAAAAQQQPPQVVPQSALPAPMVVQPWTSRGHTCYYIDSQGGNDANDGKSPDHAWLTLTKVNAGTFAPGDSILLKSGDHWDSGLSPAGIGDDRHPIKVTSYGDGPLPSLDCHAASLATVSLHNCQYWDVENLDIANTSPTPVPFLRGIEVRLKDYGVAHGIVLRGLHIHDIDSDLGKKSGGAGIFCDNYGDSVQTAYDGLLIENCTLTHVDRNGIAMDSEYTDRRNWFPSLNVVVRGNTLNDIGGDCIVLIGCDGALIEHNIVHGGRTRATDWAAGIWVWSCDNSVIQYNESSGMVGKMDAQGFDADWNTRNTLIQYNYSHDNAGGFVMVVDKGTVGAPANVGNVGTVVRYNISQNDDYRTFTCCGPIQDAQFYDNDIYVGKTLSPILIFSWDWGGTWPNNTSFKNNIFYVDGQVRNEMRNMTNTVFDSNVYWGQFDVQPPDAHALTVDPQLKAPGSAADGMNSLDGYKLLKSSPCRNAGIPIAENGGKDFWGRKLPSASQPNVGACQ